VEFSGQLPAPANLPPGTDWMGLKASTDAVAKRKIPAPTENRIPVLQTLSIISGTK
jgi:hypothetical protein